MSHTLPDLELSISRQPQDNYPQNRENNFVTFYNDLYIPLNSNKLKAKSLMRIETAIQK